MNYTMVYSHCELHLSYKDKFNNLNKILLWNFLLNLITIYAFYNHYNHNYKNMLLQSRCYIYYAFIKYEEKD